MRLGSGYIAAAFTKRIPITTPSSQKLRWLLFFALAALALLVRLPQLAQRPMHTDEAVNAYITGQLLAGEAYHYDNVDRHGPALYALAVPLAWLAGAKDLPTLDETTLRLGPVLVGALTVLLFALIVPETGLAAALIAALLWAVAALPPLSSLRCTTSSRLPARGSSCGRSAAPKAARSARRPIRPMPLMPTFMGLLMLIWIATS